MNLSKLEIWDISKSEVSVLNNKCVYTFIIDNVSVETCNDSFGHAFGNEVLPDYLNFDCDLVFVETDDDNVIADSDMLKLKKKTIEVINNLGYDKLYDLFW